MEIYGQTGQRHFLTPRIARSLYILHPFTAFIYLSILVVYAFLFNHPVFTATCFLFAILQAGYFTGLKATLKKLRIYMIFGLAVAVINPLFNHRGSHILFYLGDKQVTLEAFAYGFHVMILLLTVLTVFISVNSIISSGKLLYLFSAIAPQTAFIVNMTLRFSGVLKKKASDFTGVQKTRDSGGGKKSLLSKVKHSGKLLFAFSFWALEDGITVSETLKAKEYGRRKRTHYDAYSLTKQDVIMIFSCALIFFVLLGFRLNGAGTHDYFRRLTEFSFNGTAYALLVLYNFIPFIFDGVQNLRRGLAAWVY